TAPEAADRDAQRAGARGSALLDSPVAGRIMMNEAAVGISCMRRVALTLHALQPADRGWMLARLEPQQRIALEDMLGELQSLGISPDRQLIRQVLETAQPAALNASEEARARAMCGVLQNEAPTLRELM